MTFANRLKWMGSAELDATQVGSGFGKGIEPRNLRLCAHGATHVSLAGDWVELAQGLHELGDVVATTLNDAAMLTQSGRFPRFDIGPCGRFAMNGCQGLGFDFGEWHRVWATRRPTKPNGEPCHSLAVTGHNNAAAHHIVLIGGADEVQFSAFARRFQGEPQPRRTWPARGEHRCAGYHERFQCRKWEYVEARETGANLASTQGVPALFESLLANRIGVRTTIVSAPVVQSSLWQPKALQQHKRTLTMTAEATQLRLQLDSVSECWLVPLPADNGGGVALEFYDACDRLLLGLSAGADQENAWYDALEVLSRC